MNELMVFNNAEFGQVRTMEIDGEPWFVGKDVAEALGYSNSSKAVLVHVDNEDKQFAMIDIAHSHFGNMPIGQSKTAIINESGIYALIFGSKLPNAKKFKHWVTAEILPTIRKTGSYSIAQTKTDSYMIENPADRARRWAEEYEERLALECKIAEQQPKVDYHDAVLNKSGLTYNSKKLPTSIGGRMNCCSIHKSLFSGGDKRWQIKHINSGYTLTMSKKYFSTNALVV